MALPKDSNGKSRNRFYHGKSQILGMNVLYEYQLLQCTRVLSKTYKSKKESVTASLCISIS